jgi:outer membrane usher protein
MRPLVALAVVVLALPGRVALGAPESSHESVVELRLNGVTVPEALLVRFAADGALLIRDSDLAALRLKTPASGQVSIAGERYYRFADGDGRTLSFDAATQSVELTLPASAFVATSESGVRREIPVPTVSPGGFLNYEISLQETDEQALGGAFLEGGVFGYFGVVTTTGVARSGSEAASSARLDTTWAHDFPERLASLRVGDSINATGAWGRAARFAGVQYGTNFATQPTLVTTPLLAASGEAIVPSTVEVFVNGMPAGTTEVPPGPFQIRNVPAINGAGQMQVVVTDALGRQQVIAQDFYSGATLLQPGLDEYSFELGAIRENYGQRSFDYGDWIAAATWRRGLTDVVTAELHAEGSGAGNAALGADVALRVGRLGILSATVAGGGDDVDSGVLTGLGFEHSGRRFSVFTRSQWYSRGFAQLGTVRGQPAPRQQSFVGLGLNLATRGSLQLAYGLQSDWSGLEVTTIGAGYSRSLGDWGFLNFSTSVSTAEQRATELQLGWTLPFGERASTSTVLRQRSSQDEGSESEAVFDVQQSLPVGSGSGYDLRVSTSSDLRLGYAYQGRAGMVSLDYASEDGSKGARAGAIGGLAITGDGVLPSRVLDQSFAIVTVADYAGIPVYVDNQPIGRTDHKGRVLIDRLRAYEANDVRVDVLALPMDASLDREEIRVTPAWRSGTVVAFPVKRARALTLRLVLADGRSVPAGASVEVGSTTTAVAREGLVYLADSAAGPQQGRVRWPGQGCSFAFNREESGEPVPDLGTVTCRDDGP